MDSHTPARPGRAIILASGKVVTPDHVLRVEEDRSGPLRPGQGQVFNTWLDDQPVVIRHRTPFYASCRVLSDQGLTGLAAFYRADGVPAFVVDIEASAKLTVTETDNGPRVRKYVPFVERFVTSGRKGAASTQAAIDALHGAIAEIDGMTDEERELMDGGV